jgi:hypothetical protein
MAGLHVSADHRAQTVCGPWVRIGPPECLVAGSRLVTANIFSALLEKRLVTVQKVEISRSRSQVSPF